MRNYTITIQSVCCNYISNSLNFNLRPKTGYSRVPESPCLQHSVLSGSAAGRCADGRVVTRCRMLMKCTTQGCTCTEIREDYHYGDKGYSKICEKDSMIGMSHPFLKGFDQYAGFTVSSTKVNAEVMAPDRHITPFRNCFSFCYQFLVFASFSIPAFGETVELCFKKRDISIQSTDHAVPEAPAPTA